LWNKTRIKEHQGMSDKKAVPRLIQTHKMNILLLVGKLVQDIRNTVCIHFLLLKLFLQRFNNVHQHFATSALALRSTGRCCRHVQAQTLAVVCSQSKISLSGVQLLCAKPRAAEFNTFPDLAEISNNLTDEKLWVRLAPICCVFEFRRNARQRWFYND